MITSSYQKREEACLPDLAVLQSEEAIQEYQEPHQSSREQHPRVPAEPGEVQADLLPKIPPVTTAMSSRVSFTILHTKEYSYKRY